MKAESGRRGELRVRSLHLAMCMGAASENYFCLQAWCTWRALEQDQPAWCCPLQSLAVTNGSPYRGEGRVGGSPSPLSPGPWCGRVWEKPHCTCAPWQAARVCSEPPSHAILCFLTAGTWGPVCPVPRGVISLRLWRPLRVLVWPWPPPADGQEVLLKQQWAQHGG